MPELPAITVTTSQANRLLAAFGGQADDDGNPLTPQQAYRRWHIARLRDYVLRAESRAIDEADNAAKRDALAAVEAELPDA